MSNTTESLPSQRLLSLDALRGFDMFWIAGGEGIVHGLAALSGWWLLEGMKTQLTHVPWNGFTAYDLIFPLFLFIAGVTLPFSIGRSLEQGEPRWKLALKIVRRGLLLVLLGLIYNGLLKTGFTPQLRWGSVLGRIGLAWMFGALIYLIADLRGQIAAVVVLLLGYWGAMMFVPVPGIGAGVLEPGKTLADYVDQSLMPGRLYIHDKQGHNIRDPEGLFSTIPAVGTALFGALAGAWLRRRPIEEPHVDGVHKAAGLLLGMAACLFFVVIGANAIAIYMAVRFIDFGGVSRLLVPPNSGVMNEHLRPLLVMGIQWVCLMVMYRNRWFLRV
ncbi:MAG: DUF5009 domain-containing protein [Planctomycetes bacterium]|nr:DUF5009 domain-containing protein [Planctomycetota bacterium]